MGLDSKSALLRTVFALFIFSTGLVLQVGSVNAADTTRVSVDSAGREGNSLSGFFPAISADGRFVAFSSQASNLVANDTNDAADIFVHDRQSGQTTRVNVDSDGNEANKSIVYNDTYMIVAISADGRYVAFSSGASNLVANDTNEANDVFVHDRQSGQTTRVSVDSDGNEANGISGPLAFSADGRYVAFESLASNLVANDTNGENDIFVRDRQSGQTSRVSVDSYGNEVNSSSSYPAISADGRFVAFCSTASDLVVDDTNDIEDIFIHDRQNGQTTRVNVDSYGNEANQISSEPTISADGRYVAFESLASNLVANDYNGHGDVFVHDRQSAQTTRVSVDSDGNEANDRSDMGPAISADGRIVAFSSGASNLVANDTNGAEDIFVHDRHAENATPLFHDDMESGLDNWTLEGSDGAGGPALWTHSQHRFNSAGSALYYGKADTLDYDTGKRNFGSATSVPIDLTTVRNAQLSFYHHLRKENKLSYDIGRVQVSTDEGTSWEDVYLTSQSTEGDGLQRVEVSLAAYRSDCALASTHVIPGTTTTRVGSSMMSASMKPTPILRSCSRTTWNPSL